MSVETVKSQSSHHSSLLQSISALDYASPYLEQQQRLVAHLTQQLERIQMKIPLLSWTLKEEKKQAEDWRASKARKIASKFIGQKGKHEKRVEKEEK